MRGAVSLAAALALPFTLPGGEGFPYRDLILFVTFGVIIITLVGLGLMLPAVIRWLNLGTRAMTSARGARGRTRGTRGPRTWCAAGWRSQKASRLSDDPQAFLDFNAFG